MTKRRKSRSAGPRLKSTAAKPHRKSKRTKPQPTRKITEEQNQSDPEYEQRLRQRLDLLKKQFEAGKIKINPGLEVIESIKAVRYASDGSIDLNTVDGLVRSLALVVEAMKTREDAKKTSSLADIQQTYFEFFERNFGQLFKDAVSRGLDPHQAARALSESDTPRKAIVAGMPEFLSTIEEFWKAVGYAAHCHVEDMHESLKAIFGGDLFPSYSESIASKCGVYADTIILPDPFLRSRWAFGRWPDQRKAYFFVKHALNILKYKSLADADLKIPIVAVLPDYLQDDEQNFYLKLGQEDALLHAKKLFSKDFASIDELTDFTASLKSVDAVLSKIADPSRLLFDADWKNNPSDQLQNALNGDYSQLLGSDHPGDLVVAQAVGRMSVSNEILIKAARLHGAPVLDAPTSWQYLVWKLEYDAGRVERDQDLTQLHVLKGLQTLAANEMEWLGRVPHDALIEMRQQDVLPEIRSILGTSVGELANANPTNFHRTADQIFDNIHAAFADHKNKLKELRDKKWRFAGKDLGTWFAVGTLEVAAAATGLPVYGLATVAAHQLIDAPKLKDIPKSIKELADASAKLKRSPVGLLFSYAKKN